MTTPNGDGVQGQLRDLKQRLERLEKGRKQWLATALLTGIVFPIIVVIVTHYMINLPAEENEFEARLEYHPKHAEGSKYVLKIKNTGPREAIELIGIAVVKFEPPITALDTTKALPKTTYHGDTPQGRDTCVTSSTCKMEWGGLKPTGVMEIGFFTPGALTDLPEVRYGGDEISSWSCHLIPPTLDGFCRDNELGFTTRAR